MFKRLKAWLIAWAERHQQREARRLQEECRRLKEEVMTLNGGELIPLSPEQRRLLAEKAKRMAIELAEYGINVNAVAPGPTKTGPHMPEEPWFMVRGKSTNPLGERIEPGGQLRRLVGPDLLPRILENGDEVGSPTNPRRRRPLRRHRTRCRRVGRSRTTARSGSCCRTWACWR